MVVVMSFVKQFWIITTLLLVLVLVIIAPVIRGSASPVTPNTIIAAQPIKAASQKPSAQLGSEYPCPAIFLNPLKALSIELILSLRLSWRLIL